MSQTIINKAKYPHGSDAWLRLRNSYLGTSEWGSVLGISKYATPLDVYNNKINGATKIDNIKMRFGRDSEPMAMKWFTEETGLVCYEDPYIRLHQDYPFLATNLDGIVKDASQEIPLEFKTTSTLARANWEGVLPMTYLTQVQGQMALFGADYSYVAVMVFGFAGIEDFEVMKIYRDQEYLDIILPRLVAFWNQHIVKQTPPDAINNDDILTLFPQHEPKKEIQANPSIVDAIGELMVIKEQIKTWNDKKKELEFVIKDYMKDAELLKEHESVIATWKNGKNRTVFDRKRFALERSDIYAHYCNEQNGNRTLRLNNRR